MAAAVSAVAGGVDLKSDAMKVDDSELCPLGSDATPFPRKLYDIIMQSPDDIVAFSQDGATFQVRHLF